MSAQQRTCFAKDAWFDSILALDPDTGRIKWGFRAEDADVFNGACLVKVGGFCGGGGDFDFGNGALEWTAGGHVLVGAGAKSGTFWALDPNSGKLVWKTTLGPGGPNGGIEYGSAIGDGRVYVAEGNVKQISSRPRRLHAAQRQDDQLRLIRGTRRRDRPHSLADSRSGGRTQPG